MEKYDTARHATDGNILGRMHFSCWIIQTTNTQSEYVIRIAFARQHWLGERASMLCLHVHCPFCLMTDRKIKDTKLWWLQYLHRIKCFGIIERKVHGERL